MRRALCVGIDQYQFGPLAGCVSDAQRVAAVLARHHDGGPNFNCRQLVAPIGSAPNVVTRASLREQLEALFGQPADVAFLHFSGHGTQNNLGGYLVTQDAQRYDEGLSMGDVLQMANASPASEVVITIDCCNSGHLGNAPAVNNQAVLREGISILTASRGDQVSVETGGGGLFTSLVVDALQGGACDILGQVTAPGIYAYVEAALGAWQQRPLFKAHVSRVLALRNCAPPIERAILRELPTYFPVPAEDMPLDPSYEESAPTADPAHVAIFQHLQMLNRVYLVVPIAAAHMYGAAMGSTACKLTPSGRYYWRLAQSGQL